MILSKTKENNYPFISSCDLDLGTGNRLEGEIILSAKLYPHTERIDYAYISYVGLNPSNKSEGLIIVKSDRDVELCRVIFDIANQTEGSVVTGIAYQNGIVCGTICATRSLIPVLKARYAPRKGSFIFTPSVLNPRPNNQLGHKLLSPAGDPITGIRFGGEAFITTDGITTINAGAIDKPEAIKITSISLVVGDSTYTSTGYSNVNIRSGRGCGVRVLGGDATITIGASRDV